MRGDPVEVEIAKRSGARSTAWVGWYRWLFAVAIAAMPACSDRDDGAPQSPDSGMPESGTPDADAGDDPPDTGASEDGASDSVSPPDDTPRPLYEQSPIVFSSFDPAGTFFFSLENRTPHPINDNIAVVWTKLSPSRKRIAQQPDSALPFFEIHDVVIDPPTFRTLDLPGTLLGWASEDTLLFASTGTRGITILNHNGSERVIPFPEWVSREANGPLGSALAPDAKSAAFLTWTKGQPAAPEGFAMFVTNIDTGAVTSIWPIPANQWPGRVIWAPDGTIVYYSFAKPSIMTTKVGDAALSPPIELPFRPCELSRWVTASTLHLKENRVVGSFSECTGSWLIDTDGKNLRSRDKPAPVALSPDGLKILLLIGDELAIADPDGNSELTIRGIPRAHVPAW